jgi:hypothetical protein
VPVVEGRCWTERLLYLSAVPLVGSPEQRHQGGVGSHRSVGLLRKSGANPLGQSASPGLDLLTGVAVEQAASARAVSIISAHTAGQIIRVVTVHASHQPAAVGVALAVISDALKRLAMSSAR